MKSIEIDGDVEDFSFNTVTSRRDTNSVKWDMAGSEKMLPMWVADMDFKTAPAIIEAIERRVSHRVFGYTLTSQAFFDAIINWWERRYQISIKPGWILPVSGILPALSAIIRSFSEKGDQILLLTPVYDHFFSTIRNCEREPIESVLFYESGQYTINFADFEAKASHVSTKIVLLSNPHNPTGRVWSKSELEHIAAICLKYQVLVVSDEIHADLVHPPFKHCPFASLNQAYAQNVITCCSPSKSFNLAGVQVGYVFTENEKLRAALESIFNMQETFFLNSFASIALVAAYNESVSWLETLKDYIFENYLYLKSYCEKNLPRIKVIPLEATYLVWLDIRELNTSSADFARDLNEKQELWVNPGTMYGRAGEGFLRINIGCPRQLLEDGLGRLKAFVETI